MTVEMAPEPLHRSDESLKHQGDHSYMAQRQPRTATLQRRSASLVLLLLSSSLLALAAVPSASAVSGSLGITDSASPVPDRWYNAYQQIEFTAEVTNFIGSTNGVGRAMSWYACEGDVSAADCKADPEDQGTFTLTNIPGTTSENITSSDRWRPGQGSEGVFTVVYAFAATDQNANDDELTFTINVTQFHSDVTVNNAHDVLETIDHLAVVDGQRILNTGTSYNLTARGSAISCPSCSLDANMGWQLWTEDGNVLLDQAYRNVTNLPNWGGLEAFNQPLPPLNHGTEGTFLLKWGVFSSIGTPHGDKNTDDNLATSVLVFNNSLDLEVMNVHPTHSESATTFYFGTDRLTAEIRNNGNTTVDDIAVALEVLSPQFQTEVDETCEVDRLHPGETTTCLFPMTTTGDGRTVRVSLPNSFDGRDDVRTTDNLYSFVADIEVGPINPTIQINNPTRVFAASETVELVARYSELASQPLNFTWREGFYTFAGEHGQVLNRTGADFGLGHHNITLVARDPFGEEAYAYVEFDVLNAIPLDLAPYLTGEAVTEQDAEHETALLLPLLGRNYGIGGGASPLMMVSVNLTPTEPGADLGLRSLDLSLNLSAILPDDVDLSTVGLRYLPSTDSQLWSLIDGDNSATIAEDGTAQVQLAQPGVVLIIGVLPDLSVSTQNVSHTPLRAGQIQLDFDTQGDITNPYLGGWAVYKLSGGAGSTFFPDPLEGINAFIWEELTATTHVATLDPTVTTWVDPEPLATDVCASYAIAPVDREGVPNIHMVNITRVDGAAGLLCGDAVAPTATVSNFDHQWRFTNDTECFDRREDWSVCYEVDLTWTWPDHEAEGELTWDLYRIEHSPDGVDLSFIEPIASGLVNDPGATGSFNQNGLEVDGIRPHRTYYYVLAPIDHVGNEQFTATASSPNVERVSIQDDWWTYNQHLIPPEPEPPEPPLGVDWLQDLNDAMLTSEFQLIGMVMLVLVLLNAIALPMILKKNKRLKRVMAARRKHADSRAMQDDFDDFFE